MEFIKAAFEFFKHIDIKLVYENGQAVVLSILTLIGVLTIVFTILGRILKKVQDVTEDARIDGFLGKAIDICNRLSGVGLGILQIFPTWGTNPNTKALKARLDELEGVNSEKANDNQGQPRA